MYEDERLQELGERLREKRGFISDMDGVLYHGNRLLPGAKDFVDWLKREETFIVEDRMDTDMVAGLESEIETILVLSGVTDRDETERFAYRPHNVLKGVGKIPELAG